MFAEVPNPYLWHQRLGFHRCCFPAVRLNSVITRYKHSGLFSVPAGRQHRQLVPWPRLQKAGSRNRRGRQPLQLMLLALEHRGGLSQGRGGCGVWGMRKTLVPSGNTRAAWLSCGCSSGAMLLEQPGLVACRSPARVPHRAWKHHPGNQME